MKLSHHMPAFTSEANLVERLVGMLRAGLTPFGVVSVATEWNYNAGMTDVLACGADRELIAFEAKLRDWKTALHQAYRNTLFAHRAFVVMPAAGALIAGQHRQGFAERGVGLIALGPWGLHVIIDPPASCGPRLMEWVHDRAIAHFSSAGHPDVAPSRPAPRRHLSAT